jgi:hypothetical protein
MVKLPDFPKTVFELLSIKNGRYCPFDSPKVSPASALAVFLISFSV